MCAYAPDFRKRPGVIGACALIRTDIVSDFAVVQWMLCNEKCYDHISVNTFAEICKVMGYIRFYVNFHRKWVDLFYHTIFKIGFYCHQGGTLVVFHISGSFNKFHLK